MTRFCSLDINRGSNQYPCSAFFNTKKEFWIFKFQGNRLGHSIGKMLTTIFYTEYQATCRQTLK